MKVYGKRKEIITYNNTSPTKRKEKSFFYDNVIYYNKYYYCYVIHYSTFSYFFVLLRLLDIIYQNEILFIFLKSLLHGIELVINLVWKNIGEKRKVFAYTLKCAEAHTATLLFLIDCSVTVALLKSFA